MWAFISVIAMVLASASFYKSAQKRKWVRAFVEDHRIELQAMDQGVAANQAVIDAIVARWHVKPLQAIEILANLRQP